MINFIKFAMGRLAPTGTESLSGSGAQYIAQILFGCGLLDRTHPMPKAVWTDLFEQQIVDGRAGKNAAVVYYKQAESGMHRLQGNYKYRWWWPWGGPRGQRFRLVHSLVNVFQIFRNWAYWDMERFADVRTDLLTGLVDNYVDVTLWPRFGHHFDWVTRTSRLMFAV